MTRLQVLIKWEIKAGTCTMGHTYGTERRTGRRPGSPGPCDLAFGRLADHRPVRVV